MAKDNTGTYLLDESDWVAVVDGTKTEVGAVPKHWSEDQIAAGLTKTNRKPKAAAQSTADEAKARDYEARIAALEAELEATRAGAAGAGSTGEGKGKPQS